MTTRDVTITKDDAGLRPGILLEGPARELRAFCERALVVAPTHGETYIRTEYFDATLRDRAFTRFETARTP